MGWNPGPEYYRARRARLKLQKAAKPADEIVLSDEDGEVIRFGVVRKKVCGVICGGEQFETFIALPRLMWLERDCEGI